MLNTIIILGQIIVLIFVNNLLCMKKAHFTHTGVVCKMNGIGFVSVDYIVREFLATLLMRFCQN